MKAIDTNVLVRFLLNDDPAQSTKAKSLFLETEKRGESILIADLTVLEMIWVLRSAYRLARHQILVAIQKLAGLAIVRFQDPDVVTRFIETALKEKGELDDLFIGVVARANGAETTVTFDKNAAKSSLFTLLK